MYNLMNKKRDGQFRKFYQIADKGSKIFKYHDNDVTEFTYCYDNLEEFCKFLNEEHFEDDMEVIFKIKENKLIDIDFPRYLTARELKENYGDWYIFFNNLKKISEFYTEDFLKEFEEV